MRLTVRVAMSLVALAAATLSFQSLAHLGELCGYGGLSWLYPLVVDLGAAAACCAWLHTRGIPPLLMTWGLLATSVLLNGTVHYLGSTGTEPSWMLVVAVAAVPPIVLGLCVHLTIGMGHGSAPAADSEGEISTDGVLELHSASQEIEADPLPELLVRCADVLRDRKREQRLDPDIGRRKVLAELKDAGLPVTEWQIRRHWPALQAVVRGAE